MEVRQEVSVKVGRPTRSSFLFSKLRGLLTRAARNSSLDPWDWDTPRQKRGDYPRRRAAKITRREPLALARGINILPNLRRLQPKTMAVILITGVVQIWLSSPSFARFVGNPTSLLELTASSYHNLLLRRNNRS